MAHPTYYIETERLILRGFVAADAAGFFQMDSDPEVHRYLGRQPLRRPEEAEAMIAAIQRQYAEHGIGRWAAIERSSGHFIGWSGLKLNPGPENGRTNFVDVGYRFMPRYWGKGYATESATAALEYGFAVLRAEEIIGTCHVENAASRRVLEKCGLRYVESFVYHKGLPCHWLRVGRDEWEARRQL